jgi:hypothetical protein
MVRVSSTKVLRGHSGGITAPIAIMNTILDRNGSSGQ